MAEDSGENTQAMGCYQRWRWRYRCFLASDNDTHAVLLRKEVVVASCVAAMLIAMVWLLLGINLGAMYHIVCGGSAMLLFAALLLYICVSKTCPTAVLYFFLAGAMLFVTLGDTGAHGDLNFRSLILFLVIIDSAVMLDLHPQPRFVMLCAVLIYLLVSQLEQAFRFGLLDYPGHASYSYRSRVCSCDEPPCGSGFDYVSFAQIAINTSCVVLHHFIMSAYHHKHRRTIAATEAAVEAAEEIAACFAGYDLARAHEVLYACWDQLPPPICESFTTLLYNLESYRPFLPDSCVRPAVRPENDSEGPPTSSPSYATNQGRYKATNDGDTFSSDSEPMCDTEASQPFDTIGRLRSNHLRRARIAVLQCGVALPPCDEQTPEFAEMHCTFITLMRQAVMGQRGVLDHFAGDLATGSFNASRAAVNYAVSGLRALKAIAHAMRVELPDANARGAIVAGSAIVGTLGSTEMRRPTILGVLPELVSRVLHFQELRGFEWLCNHTVHSNSYFEQTLRVLLDTTILGVPTRELGVTDKRSVLYEVIISEGEEDLRSQRHRRVEWMYEIGDKERAWGWYNEAGLKYHESGRDLAMAFLAELKHRGQVTGAQMDMFCTALHCAQVVDLRTRWEKDDDDDDADKESTIAWSSSSSSEPQELQDASEVSLA